MNQFERIYALHNKLNTARFPVSHAALEAELECSRATVNRIIQRMRLLLEAPIAYDREANGYYYDDTEHSFSPPGLWFTEKEVLALLTLKKLLDEAQPGLLRETLTPLQGKLEKLLNHPGSGSGELSQRVRILSMAARTAGAHFQTVAGAVLQRRQLEIRYYSRGRNTTSERTVSPQRITHYRDNWYLDAWCHESDALRIFSIDCIEKASQQEQTACDVSEDHLHEQLAASYGIFAGLPEHAAILRFTPERARWVASEQWHPEQECQWLEDGRYELRVPYARPEELVLDIMSYGPGVEVAAPAALRREVARRLTQAASQYREFHSGSRIEPPAVLE